MTRDTCVTWDTVTWDSSLEGRGEASSLQAHRATWGKQMEGTRKHIPALQRTPLPPITAGPGQPEAAEATLEAVCPPPRGRQGRYSGPLGRNASVETVPGTEVPVSPC